MFMYAGSTPCAMNGPGHAFWRALNVCLQAMRVMHGPWAEVCRNCVLIMAPVIGCISCVGVRRSSSCSPAATRDRKKPIFAGP